MKTSKHSESNPLLRFPAIALTLMIWSISAFSQTNTFPSSGNVGIGTTSPTHKLDISGTGVILGGVNAGTSAQAGRFTNTGGDLIWGIDSSAGQSVITGTVKSSPYASVFGTVNSTVLQLATNNSVAMTIDTSGKVGIGTTSPTGPLHVQFTGDKALKVETTSASSGVARIQAVGPGTQAQIGLEWREDLGMALIQTGKSNNSPNLGILAGNVGIGTASPSFALDVSSSTPDLSRVSVHPQTGTEYALFQASNTAGTFYLGIDRSDGTGFGGGNNAAVLYNGANSPMQFYTNGAERIRILSGGSVGIGTTTPTTGYKLDVYGDLKVSGTGNIVAAGTINAKYQDVAEWVSSSEQLVAGTVVVLDASKSNQVISSSQPYDTRVAGVISAQPGITLGEKSDGKVLVATTGRVKVKVDASKSPIHIGDLLVTSDVPGVAMKSEPVEFAGRKMHMPGTLIGKALEPLATGSGTILVLLSLQ
jgi:hypothetical protein